MAKKKAPQIVKEIQKNPPEPVNFAYEKNISYSSYQCIPNVLKNGHYNTEMDIK